MADSAGVTEKSSFIGYKRALITGASSGIGAEFARQLAASGTDIVLVARNVTALEAVASEVRAFGVEAKVVVCDLEKPEERRALARSLPDLGVDMVINNAGYGKIGAFLDNSFEDASGQVELNVQALVELSHAAGQMFVPRGRGAIINIASTASFSPLPYFAVYGATKSFVRDFTHALAKELKGTGVFVATVSPGPTRSQFFDRSGGHAFLDKQLMMTSECVSLALEGMARGNGDIVTGFANRVQVLLAGLSPRPLKLAILAKAMKGRTE